MLTTFLMWFAVASLAGAAGGAATGVKIGGQAMGYEMAALMGGFFGISAVAPAAVVALLVLGLR
jgi:hypothetical protein